MGQSKRKGGTTAFVDAVVKVLDRAVEGTGFLPFDHGAYLTLHGAYHRAFVLPGANAADMRPYIGVLRELRARIGEADQVVLSNVPLEKGATGTLVSPGAAPHEFAAFRDLCSEMERPSWVEFQLADRATGLLVEEGPKGPRIWELRGDLAHRTLSFYPYALALDWSAPSGKARSIHDPTGTYALVSRREARAAGIPDGRDEEVVLMMTREADVLPLACIARGFADTVVEELPDPIVGRSRVAIGMGRSLGNDAMRADHGLPPWP